MATFLLHPDGAQRPRHAARTGKPRHRAERDNAPDRIRTCDLRFRRPRREFAGAPLGSGLGCTGTSARQGSSGLRPVCCPFVALPQCRFSSKALLPQPCGFEDLLRDSFGQFGFGLGVVLAGELRRLGRTLKPAFLKDRRHVGVRQEVPKTLLVPVENHPDATIIVWIAKDVRTLAPVLLSLLRALCGERIPEAVEIRSSRWTKPLGPPSVEGCHPHTEPFCSDIAHAGSRAGGDLNRKPPQMTGRINSPGWNP
jgi:hypothetical protein